MSKSVVAPSSQKPFLAIYLSFAAAIFAFLAVIGVLAVFLNSPNSQPVALSKLDNQNNFDNQANSKTSNVYTDTGNANKNIPISNNTNSFVDSNISNSGSTNPKYYLGCRLYNDKTSENKVYIRSDCDTYDCDSDPSLIRATVSDNTSVRILQGISKVKSKTRPYSFVKIEIIDTGQTGWVADSKVRCN